MNTWSGRRTWVKLRMNEMVHNKFGIHNWVGIHIYYTIFVSNFTWTDYRELGKIAIDMKQTTMSRTQNVYIVHFTTDTTTTTVTAIQNAYEIKRISCCNQFFVLAVRNGFMGVTMNRIKWKRKKSFGKLEVKQYPIEFRLFLKYVKYGCMNCTRWVQAHSFTWIWQRISRQREPTTMFLYTMVGWWIWLLHQTHRIFLFALFSLSLVWRFLWKLLMELRNEWVVRTFDFYFTSFFIMCL